MTIEKEDRPGRLGGSSRTMHNNGLYQLNLKVFKTLPRVSSGMNRWIVRDDHKKLIIPAKFKKFKRIAICIVQEEHLDCMGQFSIN